MRIYELLNPNAQSPRQQLDPKTPSPNGEDDQNGKFDANAVDNSLQDIAQTVQDRDAQPDLPSGAEQEDPGLDSQNPKPIDAALLGQIKNLGYATKWNQDDKSPLSPLAIAGMQMPDLNNLRNMVRWKMQQTLVRNQVGNDDNTDMEYYNDLLQFINTVAKFKTSNTKAQLAQTNPTPAYQTQRKPTNDNTAGAANDNIEQQKRSRA